MKIKRFFRNVVSFVLMTFVSTSIMSFSGSKVAIATDEKVQTMNDSDIISNWNPLESNVIDTVAGDRFVAVDGKDLTSDNNGGVKLGVGDKVEFDLNISKAGQYNMVLEYKITDDKILKSTVGIEGESGEVVTEVISIWKDESKEYDKDRYGNDIVSEQVKMDKMITSYVSEYSNINRTPTVFDLKAGEHKFTLENQTQEMILNKIYIVEQKKTVSYENYLNSLNGKEAGDGAIIIEAEDYIAKSHSSIRSSSIRNMDVSPYDSDVKVLNILDGSSWTLPGQSAMWEFDVEKAGLYSIGFRYSQNAKDGMSVFRTVKIDGNEVFDELNQVEFPYTMLNYDDLIASDSEGNPYKIWLEAGKHTLTMDINPKVLEGIYNELDAMMTEISLTGTEIKRLTGGKVDANRTWNIVEYLPTILDDLNNWANKLNEIYNQLAEISGTEPRFANGLKAAADNLIDITEKPEKIPNNISKLSEGSGSAAQLIGDVITNLGKQPLTLDRIFFVADGNKSPLDKESALSKGLESVTNFAKSFMPNNSYSNYKNDEEELNIWVNRPIYYVELMQQLVDSKFTPKTGIKVKFSLMPNEQKLVLANASKTNPDLVLGVGKDMPYQLAIRGAVTDLTEFDDFYDYMSKDFNMETLVPFYYEDGIYGLAETMDCNFLVYRKDIFEELNIKVPETWDDIKAIMPILQRNSMNMYLPIAGNSGIKNLAVTTPFLYQNGGSVYDSTGTAVDITSEDNIKGFELMTELFTVYSVAQNSPSFYNNFRYGIMPIGMANIGTYVMLQNAAPEIAGLWDIAPAPGIRQADGSVDRSQVASAQASFIFENSNKKEQAWEFLKWWLGKDIQVEFAYSLQNKYGPEYVWQTSNLSAFAELPFPEKHKEVMLEQWESIREVPPHPANYITEREISNAWTDIVMNGESLRVAVDKAALTANREIARKLEQFGYMENGKMIKPYPVPEGKTMKKAGDK